MRRLLEWLDLGQIISGTAHVTAGIACLAVVGGALAASIVASQATTEPVRVARTMGEPGADVIALTIKGEASNAVAAATVKASAAADSSDAAIVPAVFHGDAGDGLLDKALLDKAVVSTAVVKQPVLKIKLNDLEKERRCLTEGIYYEARGERAIGQLAVAEVVLNRVLSDRYPSTICGVVFQGAKTGRCQFSFACTNVMKHPRNPVAWRKAQRLAHYVLSGKVRNSIIGRATFYHATYVNPYWAPSMIEVAKIGQHIFYRSASDDASSDPQS